MYSIVIIYSSVSVPVRSQMKKALETVELPTKFPIGKANISIFVNILSTSIYVPFPTSQEHGRGNVT
jgi:hypothetical protein